MTAPLQHTWLAKLPEYTYEIKYKKGRENLATDAFSCSSGREMSLSAITSISTNLFGEMQASWSTDPRLQQTIQDLQ